MNNASDNRREKEIFLAVFLICVILLPTVFSIMVKGGGFSLRGVSYIQYPISIVPTFIVFVVLKPIIKCFDTDHMYFLWMMFVIGIFLISNFNLIARVMRGVPMIMVQKVLPFIYEIAVVWILSILYWIRGIFSRALEYQWIRFLVITGLIHFGLLLLFKCGIIIFIRYGERVKPHWHNAFFLIFNTCLLLALLLLMFPWLGEPL